MDTPQLCDMHCHLDFFTNPAAIAQDLRMKNIACLSCTVQPRDFCVVQSQLAINPHIRCGLGLHPWQISDKTLNNSDLDLFFDLLPQCPYIGEIGIDQGTRHGAHPDIQAAVFHRIVAACAVQGKHVLSIHAVRSAGTVLDILEETGVCQTCTCILHWFSGSSQELTRAIRMGCLFSVSSSMLASKRGKAYVQAIPAHQILLETDAPSAPGTLSDTSVLADSLLNVYQQLSSLRDLKTAQLAVHTGLQLLAPDQKILNERPLR